MTELPEARMLYRVDPADFVAARAALVKELRAAGRADDAKAAVKLRKPTAPAWALDQVANDEPELIDAALETGDALEAATAATVGGDASDLRPATDAQQEASAAVVRAAVERMPSLNADHRERVASTLLAAIVDDDIRVALVAGMLTTDHDAPLLGFSAGAGADDAPRAKRGAAAAKAALQAEPEAPAPRRKIRRVGSPSGGRARPADEVDARRQAKGQEAKISAAEARKAREAERAKARERARQQAALDQAAVAARKRAEQLDRAAVLAEEAATEARTAATAAATEAAAAEAAAAQGPPG